MIRSHLRFLNVIFILSSTLIWVSDKTYDAIIWIFMSQCVTRCHIFLSHWQNSPQIPIFIESNLSNSYTECTHSILTVISSNKTIVKLLTLLVNYFRIISDISYQGLSDISWTNYGTFGVQMGLVRFLWLNESRFWTE